MAQDSIELFSAKLRDAVSISQKRPYFLGFLDEREAAYAKEFLTCEKRVHLFWGGYSEAERVILGLFPDYLEPQPEQFPLGPLTLTFREEDVLTHRDFLGSLMALGIERTTVGDILPETGRCVIFAREEMRDYICQNLRKIGRVGVKIREGAEEPLPLHREFEEITGVVASGRLDCLVGLFCKTSREKAVGLIRQGLVSQNHREIYSPSERVQEGDLVSIRTRGRFVVDRLGPPTNKGRLAVTCRKYK